jgi:hypothetical protein
MTIVAKNSVLSISVIFILRNKTTHFKYTGCLRPIRLEDDYELWIINDNNDMEFSDPNLLTIIF